MGQQVLLGIVKSWNIKGRPEYRGFTCGLCGRPLHRAWHHWLHSGGFRTPVHLCAKCQLAIPRIMVKLPVMIDRKTFGIKFSAETENIIKRIVKSWNTQEVPGYRPFSCDKCGRNVRKAWHTWHGMGPLLAELHFCRRCGRAMGIGAIR
ncbi:MAG: hypothetical protein HY518_01345 [Candidatus Aenigmarchaeota archaeon]|nr:hypothetical protein [Candidatus Aenigmarchaeota archaeon]